MTVAEIKEKIDFTLDHTIIVTPNNLFFARNMLRKIYNMLDQLEQDQKERIDKTLNFYQATKNSNVKSVKTDVVIIDLENMKKGLGYDNTRD